MLRISGLVLLAAVAIGTTFLAQTGEARQPTAWSTLAASGQDGGVLQVQWRRCHWVRGVPGSGMGPQRVCRPRCHWVRGVPGSGMGPQRVCD
jgi:hypothetical protein